MSERTCSLEPCGRPVHARGWCTIHYQSWWVHGDPTVQKRARHGEPERLLRSWVALRSRASCWTDWPFGWINGYPAVSGLQKKAGRLVLHLDGRPWHPPLGPLMLHACDVKACLNPDHLSWGTALRNIHEAMDRGIFQVTRRKACV